MPLPQGWKLVSSVKKYSKLNISLTLDLKTRKSAPRNPTHQRISNPAESSTQFP
jgi:hypothetical protein